MALAAGPARAQAQQPGPLLRDFTDRPVEGTLYATDQHMAFSIRTSVIRWLGGVPVARDGDVRAGRTDGWWGEPVVQVSRGAVRSER